MEEKNSYKDFMDYLLNDEKDVTEWEKCYNSNIIR